MAELTSQPTSIQSLYGLYAQGKLIVNRRYQRKLVWTLEEKQKLIDSVLSKFPVPAILVAERKEVAGSYEIIDGLQRLHAIVSFIETAFPTLDERYFSLDHFPTAKARAESGEFMPVASADLLTQSEVTTFLDYTLAMSVMRNATDEQVNDVFGRINTYGHRLSDQERRQAGVSNPFSELVRNIACSVRGDASSDTLLLSKMPSISIDLPMTRHGYEVKAEDVVWVEHGILRSTELRDSLDEQCIADIAACIVGGTIIERSKDALDDVYSSGSEESERILNALNVYGADRFAQEFKYCLDEILKGCAGAGSSQKLRSLIFKKTSTNSFPSAFAVILIAFHELIVGEKRLVADYSELNSLMTDLSKRLDTSRASTQPAERRKNIDTVKGVVGQAFIPGDVAKVVYGSHATTDIDAIIRRSEIELSDYELKQGMLDLSDKRHIDTDVLQKVVNTICAMANNGPGRVGKILIGITDKVSDAKRVLQLDGVSGRVVGKRHVVGLAREAKALGLSMEDYVAKWRDAIKNSEWSSPLKEEVLAHLDFNDYFGLGVLTITIPAQKQSSTVGDDLYCRSGDQTARVLTMKDAAAVGARFK